LRRHAHALAIDFDLDRPRPVAVATGSFSAQELRDSGAEVVFEDLSDTEAFLKLL